MVLVLGLQFLNIVTVRNSPWYPSWISPKFSILELPDLPFKLPAPNNLRHAVFPHHFLAQPLMPA